MIKSGDQLNIGDLHYQLVAFPVNIHDLNGWIFFQVFSEFGDIYINTPGIEIVIVNPDGL